MTKNSGHLTKKQNKNVFQIEIKTILLIKSQTKINFIACNECLTNEWQNNKQKLNVKKIITYSHLTYINRFYTNVLETENAMKYNEIQQKYCNLNKK